MKKKLLTLGPDATLPVDDPGAALRAPRGNPTRGTALVRLPPAKAPRGAALEGWVA